MTFPLDTAGTIDPDATGAGAAAFRFAPPLRLVPRAEPVQPVRLHDAAPLLLNAARLSLKHLAEGVTPSCCDWCGKVAATERVDMRDDLDSHRQECEYAATVAALEAAGDSVTDFPRDDFDGRRDAWRKGE